MKTPRQFPIAFLLFSLVALAVPANAAPPRIDYQARDQTVILYQQAAFGVIASGTLLSYQWRKDGVPIAGATNDQIVLAHPKFSDAGLYSVVVSNAENSVTSAEAVLTVNAPKAGDVDCSFICGSSINGEVRSIAVQPDGKALIAGNFSTVHGAVRSGIARLNADGTTDYTFMNGFSGADGVVHSVAVQSGGKVLIGGSFSMVNGVGRTNIARLNADGTLDSGFPSGLSETNGPVNSIVVQSDGKVLIGGGFWSSENIGPTFIARLNTDGTLDSGFQNEFSRTSGPIYSVAVQRDGKVLVGGSFSMVNGVGRTNIARLNADGTLDSGFPSGLSETNGPVNSVVVQSDGKVLIGGGFRSPYENIGTTFIARLNTDGSLDSGFQNEFSRSRTSGSIYSVAVQSDGKVLIGGAGSFTRANGESRANVARLNADGTLDDGFQNDGAQNNLGPVNSVAVQSDGKVLIGGFLANAVSGERIARLNADGTLDSSFQNGLSGVNRDIGSMAVQSDGKVLIGGDPAAALGIDRLNADGTLDRGFLNGLSGAEEVASFAVQSDGKVLIGGNFFTVNGESRNKIARLNADGTLDSEFPVELSLVPCCTSVVSLVVQSDGKVLMSGEFITVNGERRNRIARLNADGTLDSGFQNGLSGADNQVNTVALQWDGKVLIGGLFAKVNDVSRNRIARLNADGTLDSTFHQVGFSAGSGDFPSVNSIAVQSDGKVLISGQFTKVNGMSRDHIARLNTDGTLDSAFQVGFSAGSGGVSIVVQSDDKVLIGGGFATVNGVNRNNIARLNPDGTLDGSFQNGLSGANGGVSSVAVESDGNVLIAGSFTSVNGVAAAFLARLWGMGTADIPPRIKSLNRSGADVNLIWDALSNRTYRVQYKDNLSASNWMDLTGDVSITSGTASKTDTTLGTASQRFYRVVLSP